MVKLYLYVLLFHLCIHLFYCFGFLWIFRMAATAFHQASASLPSHGYFSKSSLHHEGKNASIRLILNAFRVDFGLSRSESYYSNKRNFSVIEASSSHTTVVDPVSTPNKNNNGSNKKSSKTSRYYLPLIWIDLSCKQRYGLIYRVWSNLRILHWFACYNLSGVKLL